jgi:hypothetical protein
VCSLDVGGVRLEGVGLGAQLHELHPPPLPLAHRPRPAPASVSSSFPHSEPCSHAPRHEKAAQRESFAVRRRCEGAVGEGRLNAAIKGRAVCRAGRRKGSQGRRRAGGRRRRRPMMPWRVSDGILLTSLPALHPTLSLSLLFLCCPLASLRLPKPPFSLLAAMSIQCLSLSLSLLSA